MGIMNRMRENTSVVLWTLVIAFGGLWVLQDSGVFDTASAARLANVATVDGVPINYQSYIRAIEAQRQEYQLQTGQSMPPQLYDIYRDQIFDAMVDDILREREMTRLGVKVSDQEIIDLVFGDDPDPLIVQQFSGENGRVDRNLIRSLVDNPEMRDDWIRVEEYLTQKRRTEKFTKLIEATVRVSEKEIEAEYTKRNRTVDVQYVALRYADIPDDSVSLTDRELGEFYNRTREDYERERTLNIEYVSFSKAATRSDTNLVLSELEALRGDFAAAESDSVFLLKNGSDKGYISSYFRVDELDPEIAELVFDNLDSDGALGPVIVRNQAHLIKIGDVRDAEDVALKARHILVSAREGESSKLRSEARKKAEDLKTRIEQGEDFADLAREFSDDPGSGARGGDIGWFGPGKMVEPFEKAAKAAKVGDIVGPVETQFGYHVIEVLDRADKEAQISDLVMTLRPSIDTIRDAEDDAADLGYYARETGDFAGEVAKNERLSIETVLVQHDMDVIPGLGASRNVRGFIATAKVGDVSDVIELNDDFVVLHVAEVTPAGYRSFEEVRAELEPKARLEKKTAIQAQRLRDALTPGMDLEELAEAVGEIRRVASAVKQNNTLVPTLGRDPVFVGVALGMEREAVSPVVEGTTAAYVMRVTSIHEADLEMLTSVGRDNLRRGIENRKRQTITGRWLAELRETADVADYRYRF